MIESIQYLVNLVSIHHTIKITIQRINNIIIIISTIILNIIIISNTIINMTINIISWNN